MRTRNDLVRAVLSQLRIIAATDTPSAEDATLVVDQYADLRAELVDRGLCYWPNTGATIEEIPHEVFRALANILTAEVSDSFGKPEPQTTDEDREPVSIRVKGFRDLRRHMAKRPSGEATRFSSY